MDRSNGAAEDRSIVGLDLRLRYRIARIDRVVKGKESTVKLRNAIGG